jgi:hypothetical protein
MQGFRIHRRVWWRKFENLGRDCAYAAISLLYCSEVRFSRMVP